MKRINYFFSCSAALSALVLLTGGCTLFTPEAPSDAGYYDLEQPQRIPLKVPIEVATISSLANERFRMSFRENAVHTSSSDRNRWTQTPGILLTKYLRLAFRNEEKDAPADTSSKVRFSGEILTFDTTGSHAVLAVHYTLQYKNRSVCKTVLLREKMAEFTPEAFARAMSKAANRLGRLAAAESVLLAGKGN